MILSTFQMYLQFKLINKFLAGFSNLNAYIPDTVIK